MGEIYRLDFANGKSYIGLSTLSAAERFFRHRNSAKCSTKGLIYNAWRKHGEPKLVVLAIVEESELGPTEMRAIQVFNTMAPNGYNLSYGGELNPFLNPLVYQKFLASVSTPEYRAKQSENSKEFQASSEYRARMAQSVKAAQSRPEVRAKILAICASPERRAKNSSNKKTLWETPEYRARVSALWADPEFKSKYVSPMKSPESQARAKATWKTTEAKARKSKAMREAWKNPESKARRIEKSKARWLNPEYRARFMESRAFMQTPEYKEKMSQIMKRVRGRG